MKNTEKNTGSGLGRGEIKVGGYAIKQQNSFSINKINLIFIKPNPACFRYSKRFVLNTHTHTIIFSFKFRKWLFSCCRYYHVLWGVGGGKWKREKERKKRISCSSNYTKKVLIVITDLPAISLTISIPHFQPLPPSFPSSLLLLLPSLPSLYPSFFLIRFVVVIFKWSKKRCTAWKFFFF